MKTIYPVIAGILLLVVHAIFASLNAYMRMPILDIPMHFLGGLIVAWFFSVYFKGEQSKISRLTGIFLIVGGTATVGVLWEFLEWVIDNVFLPNASFMGGLNDTLFDLAMDLAGALAVTLFFQKQKRV